MMLDTLQQQKISYLIPSGFPTDTQIAHKTGLLNNYLHDAGILYDNNNAYTLIILLEHDKPFVIARDLIQKIVVI